MVNVFLNRCNNLRRHLNFAVYYRDNFLVRNVTHVVSEYEEVWIQLKEGIVVIVFVVVSWDFFAKSNQTKNIVTFVQNEHSIRLCFFKEFCKLCINRRKIVNVSYLWKTNNRTVDVKQGFKHCSINRNCSCKAVWCISSFEHVLIVQNVNIYRRCFYVSAEDFIHSVCNCIHFAGIINCSKLFFECRTIIRSVEFWIISKKIRNHKCEQYGNNWNEYKQRNKSGCKNFSNRLCKHYNKTYCCSWKYIWNHIFKQCSNISLGRRNRSLIKTNYNKHIHCNISIHIKRTKSRICSTQELEEVLEDPHKGNTFGNNKTLILLQLAALSFLINHKEEESSTRKKIFINWVIKENPVPREILLNIRVWEKSSRTNIHTQRFIYRNINKLKEYNINYKGI